MASAAISRELTAFRAAVLDRPPGGWPSVRSRLHDAYRVLPVAERTTALGAVALRLHATDGGPFFAREADGETWEQIFDRLSRRALGRWERARRTEDLVEAGEMWIRARAAA